MTNYTATKSVYQPKCEMQVGFADVNTASVELRRCKLTTVSDLISLGKLLYYHKII
jgi:hypothetical protein